MEEDNDNIPSTSLKVLNLLNIQVDTQQQQTVISNVANEHVANEYVSSEHVAIANEHVDNVNQSTTNAEFVQKMPQTEVSMPTPTNPIYDEWESTIAIPITEEQYNIYKQKSHKSDVIFLFKNGTRLSCRTMQKKTTTYCRNLISFYRNHWYPIRRTTAVESIEQLPPLYACDKVIFRLVVYHQNNIRISYNMEECAQGVKYNVEYEIEYKRGLSYREILIYERRLIRTVLQDNYEIKRQILSLVDLFSYVMTKVQMWHCFDPNKDYIWAYKWNGIKAKFLITDKLSDNGSNLTYIWPDANNITIEECHGNNISALVNFCFLVEIMDDCIVLIEAIGASIDQDIYTTEPATNSYVLKYLKDQNTSLKVGNKPVIIQEYYPPPLPNSYNREKFDGMIIVQDDMIIKWKIPTIDVKCIAPFKYKIADDVLDFDFEGIPGKIYEISYKNEILRQRNDRIVASSPQEYAIFLESAKHLQ